MNLPQHEFEQLSPTVGELFIKWATFLHRDVNFNHPESLIHAAPHSERVLLYALIIGEKIFGNDPERLEMLAHASVFHDTRRLDDYEDRGHGARAALYYEQYCREHPGMRFHPESVLMMRYHDIDDRRGRVGIKNSYQGALPTMLKLYDIFKDADALDRWRLGDHGLDQKFLRTEPARAMTTFSKRIVEETMDPDIRADIARQVEEILFGDKLPGKNDN